MRFRYTIAALVTLFAIPLSLFAQDFTSQSYKVNEPVLFTGGTAASPSFGLTSVIGEPAIGPSTGNSLELLGGFLYFPFVSSPVVQTTAGDAQVSLSWTLATAGSGFTVSGYSIGQSTVSGGPYGFTTVGNTLSHTETGLSDGTTYYFVVTVLDTYGSVIATSSEASATPAASGGGGGGGGGILGFLPGAGLGGGYTSANVLLSGRAYPNSMVTVLKDAQVVASTEAGADGTFSASVKISTAGNYIFSVYGEDTRGVRSSLFTFPISITSSVVTGINDIFIAPTLSADKSEVKQGDPITFFGQTFPGSQITILINSSIEEFAQTKADKNGIYQYSFNTAPLEIGAHSAKGSAATSSEVSSYGSSVAFSVGTQNVAAKPLSALRGDLNGDGKVNLVDFSILDYWYHRANPPAKVLIDGTKAVDLTDFSIMAFYWTG